MEAPFTGDTGMINISMILLALKGRWDITLLSRGSRPIPDGVGSIVADIRNEEAVAVALGGKHYDVTAQFIGFTAEDAIRDIHLFKGKTKQYIYTSSASAYQKPVTDHRITGSTSSINPYCEYSRDEIVAEDALLTADRREGLSVTIVRPSHTYNGAEPPVCVRGVEENWQILKRTMEDKPVIIPDDGSSLWTLTHSDDFAGGYVGLMGNPHAIGHTYYITNDESMTWNQIYETIAEALGKLLNAFHVASDFLARHSGPRDFRGELLSDKPSGVVFDNTKIKRAVPDFVHTVLMAEGLGQSVVYMLGRPETQVEDPEFGRWCDRIVMAQRAADQAFKKSV